MLAGGVPSAAKLGGSPVHRVEARRAIFGWLDRYLAGER
jgi:hypothetical protein